MRLHGTALLAFTAILGCAQPLGAQTDSMPRAVLDGLSVLEKPGTVATWRHDHPGDSVTLFAPAQYGDLSNDWCAEAVSYRLVSNRIVIRRAYFYVPPLSSASVLPSAGPPSAVSRDCILGAVMLEVPADANIVDTVVGRIADTLAAAWGRGVGPRDPFFYDLPGGIRRAALRGEWHRDSLVFLEGRQGAVRTLAPRAVAIGFAPVSELFEYHLAGGESAAREDAALARAESLARRDVAIARVRQATSQYDSAQRRDFGPKSDNNTIMAALRPDAMRFADAVDAFVREGKGLDSLRQAASFYLIDHIMKDVHWFEDSALRHRLEPIGATFGDDHYEGWVYDGAWLDTADRLDPHGPVHTLVSLQRFNGECSPSEAIRRAEELLKNSRDSTMRYQLYKTLGDAWADSVGVPGGPYADPSTPFSPDVQARANALQYYRAALALNRSLPSAVQAWRSSWRLLGGAPPFWLHFHCEND